MAEIRELGSFAEIKLLSDRRRLALMQLLMRAPATLSQLGQQLGMSAARVRHHLKALEAAGLVALDHTRPAGGFTEKYYRASAQAYFIHRIVLPHPAKAGTIALVGSHDPALDLLAAGLGSRERGPELLAIPVGSLNGLIALRQGLCQVTGCHLFEPLSGTYNSSHVRHFFPGQPMEMITLAHRQQGLLVQPANPKRVEGLQDLLRSDLVFINRREGSGTRLWLDWRLHELGLDPAAIAGFQTEANTHAEVAQAIQAGRADVGLAVSASARAAGLDFIPLFEERFDLVLAEPTLVDPHVARLLDSICSAPMREQIGALAGYRTSETGSQTHVV